MQLSASKKVSPVLPARSSRPRESACLNINKMILAALPSIVFGVFTIIFTLQQNQAARENRKQDQQQADELSVRTTFENYINDISTLLLNRKFNRSNPEHLLHIRVKTMTVLRHVDANRKRDVILFLYESRLLRSDQPDNERLSLVDGNLSDVHFIGTLSALLQLSHLYIPGIYAPNIIFDRCQLDLAIFDGAFMPNAKIIDSAIFNTSFDRVYAPDLTMGDVIFYQNNFQGAILHRMNFASGIDIFGTVDMTNADMLDSFTSQQTTINVSVFAHPFLILRNARLSNASFGPINDSNLVIDGGAEETVCK
ncbi:unnamed protein product [Rotaria sp. Silwood1]|nr:unnamed protein product [Rotaria sp. Silwood1]